MAVRFKAQAYRLLISGIACSNPVKGMDVRLFCLLFVVQVAAFATN